MAYTLPDLPYAYEALEPVIDAETMHLHHDKHHATYVEKLNAALAGKEDLLSMSVEELLRKFDSVPEEIKTPVKNHGGGHANHTLFWEIMTPGGATEPSGELMEAINAKFGDFEAFKKLFAEKATGQFGSGWAWLVVTAPRELEVLALPNQDSPLMTGHTPILGIDVWEHAYYLKYQNRRPEYIENWWKVVNWDIVAEKFGGSK